MSHRTLMRFLTALATIAIIGGFNDRSYANDINANTSSQAAILGSAYRSERDDFSGAQCVTGDEGSAGISSSTFSFQTALSEAEVSNELGFGAGGRAQFGAVSVSASAKFAQSTVSSDFSVSSVWLSDYRLPVAIIRNPHLTSVGTTLNASEGNWNATCGDQFVSQIQQGAKLFFSIRVDFSSIEEKKSFEAKFSLSGPLYSADTNLEQASKEFSQNTKVTITAFQVGGDVSKLTGVFNTSQTGGADFVQCTLGNFQKCAGVIQAAISYAADTKIGFPSQIAPGAVPGPAPLVYTTSDYAAAGIVHANYPFLSQVVAEARHELATTFSEQFKIKIQVDRLLDLGLGQQKLASIQGQQQIVNDNIANILTASETCFDTPSKCPDAVSHLSLGHIDEAVIALPPLPKASYRFMTTGKGLWSRADSVNFAMTPDPQKAGKPPYGMGQTKDGEASVVLSIEGVGLDTATLMFEDSSIRSIPLSLEGGRPPEKASEASALLVMDTTRGNPGWRDVNISAERDALWKGSMPRADGTFYFLVRDAFGRSVRFDIDYENWTRVTAPIIITASKVTVHIGTIPITTVADSMEPGCTISESYIEKNRWWDSSSGGTDDSGTAPFTSVVKADNLQKTPGADASKNCK